MCGSPVTTCRSRAAPVSDHVRITRAKDVTDSRCDAATTRNIGVTDPAACCSTGGTHPPAGEAAIAADHATVDDADAHGQDQQVMPDIPVERIEVRSVDELREALTNAQVDLSDWGKAGAKSVEDLMQELNDKDCYLVRKPEEGGGLVRVLEFVAMELANTKNKVLVETHQELRDGRMREVYTPITNKVRSDETWEAAIRAASTRNSSCQWTRTRSCSRHGRSR